MITPFEGFKNSATKDAVPFVLVIHILPQNGTSKDIQ